MVTEERKSEPMGEFFAPNPDTGGKPKVLLPEGWFLFTQASVIKADPSPMYPDKPRMSIRYAIDDRIKKTLPAPPAGMEQADSVWRKFGVSLHPKGFYLPRVKMHLGKHSDVVKRWFDLQGPWDPNWLNGCAIQLHIVHEIGKTTGNPYATSDDALPPDDAEQIAAATALLYRFQERDPDRFVKAFKAPIEKVIAYLKGGPAIPASEPPPTPPPAAPSMAAGSKGVTAEIAHAPEPKLPWEDDEPDAF